jgi:hypothetical protein
MCGAPVIQTQVIEAVSGLLAIELPEEYKDS